MSSDGLPPPPDLWGDEAQVVPEPAWGVPQQRGHHLRAWAAGGLLAVVAVVGGAVLVHQALRAAPEDSVENSRPKQVQRTQAFQRLAAPPAALTQVDLKGARLQLAKLAVRGRGPKTGYSRREFGPAWKDMDRNGCDTRNDILRRDLRRVVLRAGSRGCAVESGVLTDPYTALELPLGYDVPTDIEIDHVVALSDAWRTGAATWPIVRREQFANDPLNLVAVSGRANAQKGDSDAASWLPPRHDVRCLYVAAQVRVKSRYQLSVTPAEFASIERVLSVCPAS